MKTNFEHNSKSYSIDIVPSGKSQVSRSGEVDRYNPQKKSSGFRN